VAGRHTRPKRVVLSINNGRKHDPVQEFSGRTVLRSTSYTDRGTNYRAGGPDVDPADCLSTQTKVTGNCSGRLSRAGGGSLVLFSDITHFKLQMNPMTYVGATPSTLDGQAKARFVVTKVLYN
jgi:hypothetical protein